MQINREDIKAEQKTRKLLKKIKKCPNCGRKEMHLLPNNDDECIEYFIWCDCCSMSMDSDGGYIV
jgi:transcription elongation factor Elf1